MSKEIELIKKRKAKLLKKISKAVYEYAESFGFPFIEGKISTSTTEIAVGDGKPIKNYNVYVTLTTDKGGE